MKDLLVGSTGFVGGNLRHTHKFDAECHSVDVRDYYGSKPECCVYAGVPSAMFLANSEPEQDLMLMKEARENLRNIRPEKVILISTIAVFADSRGKDETDVPMSASAYGSNRYQLEQWVREDFENVIVLRLPALYGNGLKKNFLYDLNRIVPAMLNDEMYTVLAEKSDLVKESYISGNNHFHSLRKDCDFVKLREWFSANDFNAVCFTDSRSRFQFYPLSRLWNDIRIAEQEKLPLVHLCTPPISAETIYRAVKGKADWKNHISGKEPFDYDLHSRYAEAFGGKGFYLCSIDDELHDIVSFMRKLEQQGNIS